MTDSKVLLSSSNQSQVKELARTLPHAILILGKSYANENAAADSLLAQVELDTAASVHKLSLDGPSIDEVRSLSEFTRTKMGDQGDLRVILIHAADKMKPEAQNALLKQIEEPGRGITYILSATSEAPVLQTIKSRCIVLSLSVPSLEEFAAHYPDTDSLSLKAAFIASGGNIHAFERYLEGTDEVARDAKAIISANKYDRFSLGAKYEKDREQAQVLVNYMTNIFRYLAGSNRRSPKTYDQLEVCLATSHKLEQNGHVKLLLDSLFTSI